VSHLDPLVEFARPATIGRLRRAGALQPTGLIGLAGTLPWLLGRGPSLGVLSRIQGIAHGPKPAVIDRTGTVSWRDLDRRSDRMGRVLDAEGIGAGDRVALLLRNGREFVETLVGAQKLGATACPLNTWAARGELGAALEDLRPAALVYDVRHAEPLGPVVPPGVTSIAVGDDPRGLLPGAEAYEGLLAAQDAGPVSPLARRRGTPRIVIQTSGTTGRPKGASREGTGRGLGGLSALLERIPFRADDVTVCPAPLFHAFGLLNVTLSMLLGSTLVLPDAYDPEGTLAMIDRHRATTTSLVPVMLHRILALPDEVRHRHDLRSLRIVLVSGSALSSDLRERAAGTFGDVIYDLYGSTEAGWVAVAAPEDARRGAGSVGRPVEGVDVTILDPSGRPVPTGEHGEIHVRTEARFEGYVSGGQDRGREGLFPLGDVGWLDDEGFLHVEGRADDMAVIGGENVYPAEVEEVIRGVDGVEEVAVAAIPDPEYGQALAAFVVGPADPEAVLEACRRDLASFKVPRRVEPLDELPRTATGKVRRGVLVERIAKE
jgi:fatty-acyl-CoA synthase